MSITEKFNEEYYFDKYNFNHPTPIDFSICCWQKSRNISVIWVIYRLILFLYFFSTHLYITISWMMQYSSYERLKLLLYGGYWVYLFQSDAYFLTFLMTIISYSNQKNGKPDEPHKFLYILTWISYSILPSCVTISVVSFWTLVHDDVYFPSNPRNLIMYTANFPLMVLDFMLIAFPIRLNHFYIPVFAYFIYTAILSAYAYGGHYGVDGLKYVYRNFDLKNDFYRPGFYLLLFGSQLSSIHDIFCIVSFLKMLWRDAFADKNN